ncbi:MAG: gamma-glutamylcyclotransferase [Saprospiraceae bacterium]
MEKGIVKGKLYKIGWGANLGYYGFKHVPIEEQEEIPAHILFSNQLTKNWQMLDDFEGEEYQRVLIDFELENGEFGIGYFYKLK